MHYRAAAHVVHVTAARDDGPADHDQDDRGQDDKGPRRRSTGAGKGAASADAPAALLFAAVAVLACCAAVLSKHRQYQGAQQYYQARLAAEHAAAEALQLEQQQLQDAMAAVTTLADTASSANAQCLRESDALSADLLAKEDERHGLQRRAEELEAARARLKAEVLSLREHVAAAEERAVDAEAQLADERRRRERLEGEAGKLGLLRHTQRDEGARGIAPQHNGELALLAKHLARRGDILLSVCDHGSTYPNDFLSVFLRQAQHLGLTNALVVTADRVVPTKVKALGMDAVLLNPEAPPATRIAAVKWAAIGVLLDLGHSVLYSDLDVALLGDPFPLLGRDADLEAMGTAQGEPEAYGRDQAPSTAAAVVSPGLLYLRPTQAAINLTTRMVLGLSSGLESEAALLSKATLKPGPEGQADGARLRLMPYGRFLSGGALARTAAGTGAAARAGMVAGSRLDVWRGGAGSGGTGDISKGAGSGGGAGHLQVLSDYGTVAVHFGSGSSGDGGGGDASTSADGSNSPEERLQLVKAAIAYSRGKPQALATLLAPSRQASGRATGSAWGRNRNHARSSRLFG